MSRTHILNLGSRALCASLSWTHSLAFACDISFLLSCSNFFKVPADVIPLAIVLWLTLSLNAQTIQDQPHRHYLPDIMHLPGILHTTRKWTWPSGRQRADRSGPVAFHARGTFAPVDPQHLRLLWRAAAQPPRSLVHSPHCSGKGRVAERGCCKANTQDAHATSTEVTEPRSPMCLNNRTLPFLYARCGCAFAFGRPVVRSRLTL